MTAKSTKATSKSKKKIVLYIVGSLLVLLIALRIALPYIVLKYVNKQLSELKEYYGHTNDIDIALWRGAYVIKDLKLVKVENGKKIDSLPVFKAPVIDLSVQWKALFNGRVVGELFFDEPVVNFVKGTHEGENVKQDTADFRDLLHNLMPLTVNHFEINNGQIHYIDKAAKPVVDLAMKNIDVYATNMSNVEKKGDLLPASMRATGVVYEGKFVMNVKFDGLNKVPTFDLNADLKNMNLTRVNSMFKAYGNFEVTQGIFNVYTEFAAKKGEFGGYVKPVIKDFKVNHNEGSLPHKLYTSLVGLGAHLLENPKTDQIATKLDIKGRFDDPNVNIWRAVSILLRNAFVKALQPSVDNTINIGQLEEPGKKTFLERIFGGKDKKKEEKKK